MSSYMGTGSISLRSLVINEILINKMCFHFQRILKTLNVIMGVYDLEIRRL
ncbi:hypothetical protein NMY3_03192 [Candidatus Nitrosocosmicus oleophilus]|uniref:Uncharacterized protein n=1 Tax=Candidatus Nitrosocosmicus oleophilus TaxID=1353260 RepID=A0A654M2G3_9ARCH|nr:hypothetical protein NMY3_03192 [Candidatus Nitrosocosmicus oleophilus]